MRGAFQKWVTDVAVARKFGIACFIDDKIRTIYNYIWALESSCQLPMTLQAKIDDFYNDFVRGNVCTPFTGIETITCAIVLSDETDSGIACSTIKLVPL